MNLTKTASTVGVGAAIIAGSLLAVSSVSAHSGGSNEKQAERVSSLAERFNLDEEEVNTYFEEQKAERDSEREAKKAEHISSLVEAGTLTQTQADELIALKEEARTSIQELKESGAGREEIKRVMDENRSAVEAWASEQGINLDDIRPEGQEKDGHGHHRGKMRGTE